MRGFCRTWLALRLHPLFREEVGPGGAEAGGADATLAAIWPSSPPKLCPGWDKNLDVAERPGGGVTLWAGLFLKSVAKSWVLPIAALFFCQGGRA